MAKNRESKTLNESLDGQIDPQIQQNLRKFKNDCDLTQNYLLNLKKELRK